ncbi:MAG: polyribonucleotide nucleotidyltransferase [Chloroflexi bacterium]|uniref:Polyribonucleotide nucleotidyltransferase n=1 Tax=Candidatus Chlorohelix allophototropha TaxID=3003348 RepID=A0A8T7LWS9_9CHLR|nr:polyribonucleotide nucleotidyltransferase [Chloroflexota bacterium]
MSERQIQKFETVIGGRNYSIEVGRVAEQAHGAVLVRYGDTMVLATVVASSEPREGQDFFPLTIEYEERMYAAGKIPGGFIKREGRPSENSILISRLTDRPLRPLFPKGYFNEVLVQITVLSTDQENEPDTMSIIGASCAIGLAGLPFGGPVSAVKVGYIDGEFICNPTAHELADSKLDLTVAGTEDAVMMVEAGAWELSEEIMLEAVKFGFNELQAGIRLQKQVFEAVGVVKQTYTVPVVDESLKSEIKGWLGDKLRGAVRNADKNARVEATENLRKETIANFTQGFEDETQLAERTKAAEKYFDSLLKEEVRTAITNEGIRPDGRAVDEIRPISCETGLLPRTHGSALFTRGQTQILSVTTLGTSGEEQILDGLGLEESKRFIHHYNFPPFSTGEVKRLRGPSRRDIGHGALAERSLVPVIPDENDFPYTIRVVSETLSSNGSSSMGSVCAGTLSLMDAGVPIKAQVAGVAMGLVTDSEGGWKVLTDIQGIEDALGDMDFKVAGTENGVTGLQMDIKTTGITFEIMQEGFKQALKGRLFILGKMQEALSNSRPELSPFAPRIVRIQINPEKIGALIGPGGKNIRAIIEETGAKIDVEDDGSVFVASVDGESAKAAIRRIEALTKEAEIGAIYLGKVVRIMPYGAFIEILPGKDGLVHISELADYHVQRVEDVVNLGDEINVMVTEVDKNGKITLSRRAILTGQMPAPQKSGGGDRGGDRGGPGGGRDRDSRPGGGGSRPPSGRSDSRGGGNRRF